MGVRPVHAWLRSLSAAGGGQRLPGLSGPRVAHRAAPLWGRVVAGRFRSTGRAWRLPSPCRSC